MDIALNLLIFLVTTGLVLSFPRKDGEWRPERWKAAFRFFTVQSNVLCAAACLLTAAFAMTGEVPEWVWLLKYAGTAAVTVTMLTVPGSVGGERLGQSTSDRNPFRSVYAPADTGGGTGFLLCI